MSLFTVSSLKMQPRGRANPLLGNLWEREM